MSQNSQNDYDEDPEDLENWRVQRSGRGRRSARRDPLAPSQDSVDRANLLQDEALDWKTPDSDRPTNRQHQSNDIEVFMIGTEDNLKIFTKNRESLLREIERKTDCHLLLRKEDMIIDIWGSTPEMIAEAKVQLSNGLLTYGTTAKERPKNKWAKPDRALTDKERKRKERKDDLKKESDLYIKTRDPSNKPFVGIFMIPNDNTPIGQIIGFDEKKLNEIRVQSKCFISYEPPPENAIKIAGDTKESVNIATMRVKNLFLTFYNRRTQDKLVYLLDQPSENFKIRFTRLPGGLETPSIPPEGKCFYTVKKFVNVVDDLVDLGEGELSGRLPTNQLPPRVLMLNKKNANILEKMMEITLDQIRLLDGAIRMKIRFGQFCANLPKVDVDEDEDEDVGEEKDMDENEDLTILSVAYKHFRNPNFIAELAPCMAKKEANIKPLKEFLDKHCRKKLTDSLRDTFVFGVEQQLEFVQPSKMRQPGSSRKCYTRIICSFKKDAHVGPWDGVTDKGFKNDGHVGLWDCVMDEKSLMSANMVNLDRNYAWELRLDTASLVPPNGPAPHNGPTPHGQFVNGLRLNKNNNRLLYTNRKELMVHSITQKTKWLYYWSKNNYVIEVCRDRIWDRELSQEKVIELEFNLAQEPDSEIYRVSMYKEDWNNRFAMNLNLSIGMAPDWTIEDFLHTRDENAGQLISDAREFTDLLTKIVPLYWEEDVE